MKAKFTVGIMIMFLSVGLTLGQKTQVINLNYGNYPNNSFDVYFVDENHDLITNVKENEIKLYSNLGNTSELKVVSFTREPNEIVNPYNLTVAFDNSFGKSGNDADFELSKHLLKEILKKVRGTTRKISVTSFDHLSYLHQPATADFDSVMSSINFIKDTEYSFVSSVFENSPTSGFENAKSEIDSRLLIFTDDMDEVDATTLIESAKSSNIAVYVVSISSKPSISLTKLAEETGGFVYYVEMSDNTKEDDMDYTAEFFKARFLALSPYHFEYIASPVWNHQNYLVVKNERYTNCLASTMFKDEFDQHPCLEFEVEGKPYLGFSAVPVNGETSKDVKITARNGDVRIYGVEILTDKGGEIRYNLPEFNDILKIMSDNHTELLKQDQSFTVKIKYSPETQEMIFTKLRVSTDAIYGREMFITAGYPSVAPSGVPTIEILSPEKNAVYKVGDTVPVIWEGLLPEDMVHLTLLSTVDGKTTRVDSLERVEDGIYGEYLINDSYPGISLPGIKRNWTFDNGEIDSCQIELIQWWPNKIGKTTVLEHNDAVNSAYFSHTLNLRVITASADSTISIWKTQTGNLEKNLKVHDAAVNYAEFSNDDNFFLTASDDKTVKIWDAKSYDLINTFQLSAPCKTAKFSIQSDYVIAADMKANIYVWKISDPGTPIYKKSVKPSSYQNNIKNLDIHPTKNGLFMFCSYDGSSIYFDDFLNPSSNFLNRLNIKDELGKNATNLDVPYCKFNEDGDMFAVISSPAEVNGATVDKNISLWDFNSNTYDFSLRTTLDTNQCGAAKSVSFKNDAVLGRMMIIANERNNIFVWDIDNSRPHTDFPEGTPEHTEDVNTAVFNFDSSVMLTSSLDSTARIWYRNNISVQVDTSDYFSVKLPKISSPGYNFDLTPVTFIRDAIEGFNLKRESRVPVKINKINVIDDAEGNFSLLNQYGTEEGINQIDWIDTSIPIRYSPKSKGQHTAKVEIEYENNIPQHYFDKGDVSEKFVFEIEGAGYVKELENKVNIIDFGEIEKDEAFAITVSNFIENTSPLPIEISKIALDGFAKDEFIIQDTGIESYPFTLNPGEKLPIRVAFTPKEYGAKSAQIYYNCNGNFTPVPINLFGIGSPVTSDSIRIKIEDFSGKPGDIVDVPILLEEKYLEKTDEKIEGFTGYIKFNKTLLEPVGDFEIDSTFGMMRIIKINLPKEADENNILKTIQFKVGLGNDTLSPVVLDEFVPIGLAKVKVHEESAQFTLKGYCETGDTPRLFDQDGLIKLAQNAPNPFSEKTTFSFDVLEKGTTKLYITTSNGKLVKTIVEEDLEAGHYEYTFSAEGIAPGKYFYTLETPTQRHSKSLVIER